MYRRLKMKKAIIYLGLLATVSLILVCPNQNALASDSIYIRECIYTYQEGAEPVAQYYAQVIEIYMPCPEPPLHPNNSGGELHPLFYQRTVDGIEYYYGVTPENNNCEVTAKTQTRLRIGDGTMPELGPL